MLAARIRRVAAATLFAGACVAGALTAGCGSTPTNSAGGAPSSHTAAATVAHSRPNIVVFLSDDHARQAISAYGGLLEDVAPTPNIDRLAAQGALFENALVGNSICAPARASVLTGLHSHANGVRDNGDTFDGSQQTFPQLLQAAGYQTALVGKWHLKSDPTGFDHWEVLHGQGPYYNPKMLTPDGDVARHGYTTDIITDLAVQWLDGERDPDRPFLLCVWHKAPHRHWMPEPDHFDDYDGELIPEPNTLFDDHVGRSSAALASEMSVAHHLSPHDLKLVEQPWLDDEQRAAWDAAYDPKNAEFEALGLTGDALVRWKYQRYLKDYLRCVASVDESVGEVLDALDDAGLEDDTVVVYTSDQGFYLGDHGWYDKRWMYEESLSTPLIVRWPGVTPEGLRVEAMVQNIDFAPTFVEIAGAEAPEPMHGTSFVPLLSGAVPDDWRDAVYYRYYEFPGVHAVARHHGIRTDTDKLIRFGQLDAWEYYDLVADPEELVNAYETADQGRIAELKTRLAKLQAGYGDAP